MADETQNTETKLARELVAKTADALAKTGFDAGFDAEVDAAIQKDAAAETAKAQPAPKPVEQKPEPAPTPKPAEKSPEKKEEASIPDDLFKKKEEAKPTEIKTQTDEDREKFIKEQTKDLSPKAADRFRALEKAKHEAEQRAARASQLEKELNEIREQAKQAADDSEAKALRKQVEELDAIVKKQALADHPQFKAHYDEKIGKEIYIARKMAGEKNADEVEALLKIPESRERNRRLNELAADLEDTEKSKLLGAIDRNDRLVTERNDELNNWKLNAKRMQDLAQQDQALTQEQRKKALDNAINSVIPKFTDPEKGVEIFRSVEGNDQWNKAVESRITAVKKIVNSDLTPADVTEMAAWAISGQEYRKLFITQRALVARLQEEIASLKAGEPDLGEGQGKTAETEEKGDFVDVVAGMAQKEGALR